MPEPATRGQVRALWVALALLAALWLLESWWANSMREAYNFNHGKELSYIKGRLDEGDDNAGRDLQVDP